MIKLFGASLVTARLLQDESKYFTSDNLATLWRFASVSEGRNFVPNLIWFDFEGDCTFSLLVKNNQKAGANGTCAFVEEISAMLITPVPED